MSAELDEETERLLNRVEYEIQWGTTAQQVRAMDDVRARFRALMTEVMDGLEKALIEKEENVLTAQEAIDLDSCIQDSLTLNELHPVEPWVEFEAETLAYLDRIRVLRVKMADIFDPIPASFSIKANGS